ncbi:MAG: transketolase, partial [Bacillota bacterium]|nr:transketolase [Bacillota bacterium]
GNDGPTHQATEDIGIFRTIPGMTVVMPADEVATKPLLDQALALPGPVYIRLTRDAVPTLYGEDQKFFIGKAIERRPGEDLTIIAVGDMLYWAERAADELEGMGFTVRVLDMHTIKPIDREAVLAAAEETGAIVTVEDHNVINGLGSAVSDVVCDAYPVPVKRVGLPDTFAESGPYELLLEKYGMHVKHIVTAAKAALELKARLHRHVRRG